jgi:hypothetical protein
MTTTHTTSITEQDGTDLVPGATDPAPASRRFLRRIATVVVAAGVILGSTAMASPASAATSNQWVAYDLVTTDRDYEMWIYFDAYGRATQVYADVNNNGTLDAWSRLRNGQPEAWLFNTVYEFDGRWDTMLNSNGDTYSNMSCTSGASGGLVGGGYYSAGLATTWIDPVYGLGWCSGSSRLNGIITAPNLTGDYVLTLTRLVGVAPALHCYNGYYSTGYSCWYRSL